MVIHSNFPNLDLQDPDTFTQCISGLGALKVSTLPRKSPYKHSILKPS